MGSKIFLFQESRCVQAFIKSLRPHFLGCVFYFLFFQNMTQNPPPWKRNLIASPPESVFHCWVRQTPDIGTGTMSNADGLRVWMRLGQLGMSPMWHVPAARRTSTKRRYQDAT